MRPIGWFPALMIATIAVIPAGCSRGAERSAGGESSGDARLSSPSDWNGLRDFTAIEVVGPDDVIVTQGKDFAVKVEGAAETIAKMEIKRDGDTLRIGRRKQFGVDWSSGEGVTVRVTMPDITALSLTGSGNLEADRVAAAGLKTELTGSGNLRIAAAKLDELAADITGSGDMEISGTTGAANISITGTGDFKGEALKAGRAKVSILGTGDSNFASDGPVNISIMGTGDATVKGRAKCRTKVMGTGEARCAP